MNKSSIVFGNYDKNIFTKENVDDKIDETEYSDEESITQSA